ncbi:MAG: helix-turn-helix transcriptional regulator [Halobacteria archaeon]
MRTRTMLAAAAILILVAVTGSIYQLGGVEVDSTTTQVDISEDGDAVFSLELRTRLEGENETAAFRNVSEGEVLLTNYRLAMSRLVERVDQDAERSMSAENFSETSSIESVPVNRGVVRYNFTWINFAEVRNDSLTMDGVLSGYVLGSGDSLVVRYPVDYELVSVDPEPSKKLNGRVVWEGEFGFSGDEPRLVVQESKDDLTQKDRKDIQYVVVLVLILLVILGVAFYFFGRRVRDDSVDGDAADTEVIKDSEVVLRILDAEGGEMKQKTLVEETDWSQSKVSQVTSGLEDQGEIEKLRMGRENIIRFPEIDEGER